jgi:DNA-binding transcriptional LysR family regulator
MIEWDDLRFVLAVSRSGSALGAAGVLGVDQTTVVRRLARLEAGIGAELLERRQRGHGLTLLGKRFAAVAERIEEEVVALENAIGSERRLLTKAVRFTTSEALANSLIAPFLKKLRQRHPRITIELVVGDRRFDVAGGEADLALRGGSRPTGTGIVARRLPDVAWAAYCGTSYVQEHGVPDAVAALNDHMVVGPEGAMTRFPGAVWLGRVAPRAKISTRSNSLTNLAQAVKAGLGVAVLPCILADSDAAFVRCTPPIAELDAELWLIVRQAARRVSHVRAVVDLLVEHVETLRADLAGAPAKRRADRTRPRPKAIR